MSKALPPTYFLGAGVLAVALHFALPLQQVLMFPWRLTGLAPLGIGIVLNLLADQAFKRHDTTVKPFEKSNALVVDGVFGISRNPMYLGMTFILLGAALLLGSLSPFAVVVALPILLDRIFIVPEEKMLEDRFGDQFRAYRKCVRKWI
jgi:protein-S-isoprenylcysteine O-methyltransferase Ste14